MGVKQIGYPLFFVLEQVDHFQQGEKSKRLITLMLDFVRSFSITQDGILCAL